MDTNVLNQCTHTQTNIKRKIYSKQTVNCLLNRNIHGCCSLHTYRIHRVQRNDDNDGNDDDHDDDEEEKLHLNYEQKKENNLKIHKRKCNTFDVLF